MPLKIVRDNIVHLHTDAIVNAANSRLLPGGGVCGSIFDAAGFDELLAACGLIGGCAPGSAVITPGFRLPARFIIHAVGPVWRGGGQGEEQLLRACYKSALTLAAAHELRSVAFPLISTGIFGYPKDRALQAAVHEIGAFLLEHEMEVVLVVYDAQSFQLSEKLFCDITAYIDDLYVRRREKLDHLRMPPGVLTGECAARLADINGKENKSADRRFGRRPDRMRGTNSPLCQAAPCETAALPPTRCHAVPGETIAPPPTLRDALRGRLGPFVPTLLALIDQKGMTDVAVYKRANIDRKLFSKIRSNRQYRPSKPTAVALAVALRLTLSETQDLLARAGYTLSRAQKADIIVEYFITRQNFNIHEINEALFVFDQLLLGA